MLASAEAWIEASYGGGSGDDGAPASPGYDDSDGRPVVNAYIDAKADEAGFVP